MEEKITADITKDKLNPVRVFGYICKKNLLFHCIKCNHLLTSNAIVEKLLRLKNGRICFILNDNDIEIFNRFKNNIIIENILEINTNPDLYNVGINKVYCKYCKNQIGIKIKQTDETQFFMINKILLKENTMQYYSIENMGIKPFYFQYSSEEVKRMDRNAFELEQYINDSCNQLTEFLDLIKKKKNDLNDNKKRLEDIKKLSDILTYLVNKNYI